MGALLYLRCEYYVDDVVAVHSGVKRQYFETASISLIVAGKGRFRLEFIGALEHLIHFFLDHLRLFLFLVRCVLNELVLYAVVLSLQDVEDDLVPIAPLDL